MNQPIIVQPSDIEAEQQHAIALGMIPGIGPFLARQLVKYCGSARNVLQINNKQLRRIPGIGPKTASSIINCNRRNYLQKAEDEIRYCQDHQIKILTYHDASFPAKLRHCHDSPFLLYMKGSTTINSSRTISIVGSRKASPYGKKLTNELVAALASSGVTIVSGLALGIDGTAHKACLDNHVPTIAVLAHGLDTVYPAAHRNLSHNIVESEGALITEYAKGTSPEKMHFPARNRIVAGMADAVVVVESGVKGGALITADIANSYSRDVFAIPGRVGDLTSEGCNKLIRQNKAALITSAADIFYSMNWEAIPEDANSHPAQPQPPDGLNSLELVIYRHITRSSSGTTIDEILKIRDMDSHRIRQNLLSLELKGAIRRLPGNSFAKV